MKQGVTCRAPAACLRSRNVLLRCTLATPATCTCQPYHTHPTTVSPHTHTPPPPCPPQVNAAEIGEERLGEFLHVASMLQPLYAGRALELELLGVDQASLATAAPIADCFEIAYYCVRNSMLHPKFRTMPPLHTYIWLGTWPRPGQAAAVCWCIPCGALHASVCRLLAALTLASGKPSGL